MKKNIRLNFYLHKGIKYWPNAPQKAPEIAVIQIVSYILCRIHKKQIKACTMRELRWKTGVGPRLLNEYL